MLKPTFSPQITFGNILQIGVIAAGVLGAYFTLDKRLTVVEGTASSNAVVIKDAASLLSEMQIMMVRMQANQENIMVWQQALDGKTADRFTSKDALPLAARITALETEIQLRRGWGDRLTSLETVVFEKGK